MRRDRRGEGEEKKEMEKNREERKGRRKGKLMRSICKNIQDALFFLNDWSPAGALGARRRHNEIDSVVSFMFIHSPVPILIACYYAWRWLFRDVEMPLFIFFGLFMVCYHMTTHFFRNGVRAYINTLINTLYSFYVMMVSRMNHNFFFVLCLGFCPTEIFERWIYDLDGWKSRFWDFVTAICASLY